MGKITNLAKLLLRVLSIKTLFEILIECIITPPESLKNCIGTLLKGLFIAALSQVVFSVIRWLSKRRKRKCIVVVVMVNGQQGNSPATDLPTEPLCFAVYCYSSVSRKYVSIVVYMKCVMNMRGELISRAKPLCCYPVAISIPILTDAQTILLLYHTLPTHGSPPVWTIF